MRIKIVSNFRSECDTIFSIPDDTVPGIGDEVVWVKREVRYRGTVAARKFDYTITPTRTDRFEVILQMKNTEPVYNAVVEEEAFPYSADEMVSRYRDGLVAFQDTIDSLLLAVIGGKLDRFLAVETICSLAGKYGKL